MSLKSYIKSIPLGRLLAEKRKTIIYRNKAKYISDYDYIKKHYKRATGRDVNLKEPDRFTEKLQWLKLFWRDERATICANKYTVKKYLEDLGYGYLLNETIAYYTNVDDIDIDTLPDTFVLKGTHGSGWNLIVKNKKNVNWPIWKAIMRSWLKQDLSWYGREWVYKNQPHGIIIENYLEDDSGELRDFKVCCSYGNTLYMQVDENRYTNHKRFYYTSDGNTLPMGNYQELNHQNKVFGENQKKMFQIASELSKPFPYVRCDFYECNGRIFFGELTFFGGSGFYKYKPDKWDYIWGEKIRLPAPNYNLELYKQIIG